MDAALRGFDTWLNGGGPPTLILALFTNVLLMPVFVLIHELGHAAVRLMWSEGLVVVSVGRTPARWRTRIGRLQLELNPVLPRRKPAGTARTFGRPDPRVGRALDSVAGPVSHAFAAGAVLLVGVELHSAFITLTGGIAVLYALLNLAPFKRHGFRSDGAQLATAVAGAAPSAQGLFAGPLGDTFTRWYVLYSDQRLRTASRVRGVALATCASALGFERDEDGVALWELAFAGWCWRESERGGDFSRVRESALDGLHAATVTGVVEPRLTALAARNHAESPCDLGLASPGADDGERVRVLVDAFRGLPAGLRSAKLPLEQQQFAFRYGVALRDIERIRF